MNIKVPEELIARESKGDHVTFKACCDFKKTGWSSHTSQPCYSFYSHNAHFLHTEFILYPNIGNKSCLSFEDYEKWFHIFKNYKLIDDHVEISCEKSSNIMTIPLGSSNRHRLYAALCCYRWSDANPKTVYTILRAFEQDVSFFQAFHYGMGKYYTNTNHSFCRIGAGAYAHCNCVANSAIIPIFFANDSLIASVAKHTNDGLVEILKKRKLFDFKKMTINNVDDILLDKWAKLYNLTDEQFNWDHINDIL